MKNLVKNIILKIHDFVERNSKSRRDLAEVIEKRFNDLEDTVNMFCRKSVRPVGAIKVVFLVHHATSWIATLPVVRAMLADTRFHPVVISLPHINLMCETKTLEGECVVHAMLEAQNIEHIRIKEGDVDNAPLIVKSLAPDAIFRQTPWSHDLPDCLSGRALSFTRICYIPYGYMSAAIEQQQYNQTFHKLCWRIFCPSQIDKDLFRDFNDLHDLACVLTGYPKFDILASAVPCRWPISTKNNSQKPFKLIWAPHWSYKDDWLKFGTFLSAAPVMLYLVKSLPWLQIVMRPHPVFTEYLDQPMLDSSVKKFVDEWNALPNTAFSREPDYGPLFAASDALVTDGVSFLSEYQLFDKPLVFIERADSIGFNKAGKRLLDGTYRITEVSSLEGLLLKLYNGNEDLKIKEYRAVIASELQPYPGKSAQNILEAIHSGLS